MRVIKEVNIKSIKKGYLVTVLINDNGFGLIAYYKVIDSLDKLSNQLVEHVKDYGSKLSLEEAKSLFVFNQEDYLN